MPGDGRNGTAPQPPARDQRERGFAPSERRARGALCGGRWAGGAQAGAGTPRSVRSVRRRRAPRKRSSERGFTPRERGGPAHAPVGHFCGGWRVGCRRPPAKVERSWGFTATASAAEGTGGHFRGRAVGVAAEPPAKGQASGDSLPASAGGPGGTSAAGGGVRLPQSPPQNIVGAPWPGRPEEGEDDSKYQLRAPAADNQ